MEICVKPGISVLNIVREYHSGAWKVSGIISFCNPEGIEISTKVFNTFGGITMEFSAKTLDSINALRDLVNTEIAFALQGEIDQALQKHALVPESA